MNGGTVAPKRNLRYSVHVDDGYARLRVPAGAALDVDAIRERARAAAAIRASA